MAINSVEMFGVECDHCNKQLTVHDKVSYWMDEGSAEQTAINMDWNINEEGDLYCPACSHIDEDGRIILDESRRGQFEASIDAGGGEGVLQDRMKMADAIEDAKPEESGYKKMFNMLEELLQPNTWENQWSDKKEKAINLLEEERARLKQPEFPKDNQTKHQEG